MQHKIHRCGFLLLAVLSTAAAAQQIRIDNTGENEIYPGNTEIVSVWLDNVDPTWAGVNGTIQLPPEISLVNAWPSPDIGGFQVDAHGAGGTEIGFLAYSDTQSFGATSVEALRIRIQADPAIAPGDYPITFVANSTGISDATGANSIPHTTADGTLTVLSGSSLPMHPIATVLCGAMILTIAMFARRHRYKKLNAPS